MALKMGLSYIELARIGLTALESWLRTKPDIVKQNLPDILPLLNDYLSLDSEEYEEKVNSRLEAAFKFKQRVSIQKKSTATILEQVGLLNIRNINEFNFGIIRVKQ